MSSPFPHSPSLPLFPAEKKARDHALVASIGFLILLPLGTLIARYLRTFTNGWFWPHAAVNFLISGPVIFAGWALGIQANSRFGGTVSDAHKRIGTALMILYIIQIFIGVFIHYVKIPIRIPGGRPPQNYLHAILGIVILALASWQVHNGIYTEWPQITGNIHPVRQSAKHAWLALIIVFWALYGLGLGFLPRQYKQESSRRSVNEKETPDGIKLSDAA
ncbi:hypothetical protein FA95DRAFT_587096 [Auriscalpium vulgare]|uniref:Uncharacterized protein n=1 Tax=Auriscalpium vulgare TaxID=40419 RepID=A0ACB8RFG9_9AGAM|nr:hypothetical protein FA95DRAFT_587096 [Auriscalpium vulgare]